jgi:hypothetical protein
VQVDHIGLERSQPFGHRHARPHHKLLVHARRVAKGAQPRHAHARLLASIGMAPVAGGHDHHRVSAPHHAVREALRHQSGAAHHGRKRLAEMCNPQAASPARLKRLS